MGLSIRLSRLVYISADSDHIASVKDLAEKWCNDLSNPFEFNCSAIKSPFQIYLGALELIKSGKSRLSAIIDYKSFLSKNSQRGDYATVIRDVILCFPEINFYFDVTDSPSEHPKSKSFLDMFINASGLAIPENLQNKVNLKLHSFSRDKSDSPFESFIQGKDNLYDASNLRYFMKMVRYHELSLRQNFQTIQESRSSQIALCVEEERSQSLFNSVALYLNGYRVLPITSACELRWANENIVPDIIIRDYDLQFSDASKSYSKTRTRKRGVDDSQAEISKSDVIHIVRGWRFNKVWSSTLDKNNPYWSNYHSIPTFYISKGAQNPRGYTNLILTIPKSQDGNNQQFVNGIGEAVLELPGIYKPVSGIYTPFHQIDIIRKRYEHCYKEEEGGLPVITNRTEEGGHGVPLDIYGIVKSMVDRAEGYYENKRFVHAVIVANDAIEIMNGFHQALTIRAYRCLAMAENALATNILGGDENCLQIDTSFRLNKIEKEVTRIASIGNKTDSLNVSKRRNMLNQIYNEIRVYCKEREHFDAENAVIRKMGHLNEGLSLSTLVRSIISIFRKNQNDK